MIEHADRGDGGQCFHGRESRGARPRAGIGQAGGGEIGRLRLQMTQRGGNGGIGYATAHRLAQAGAKVVLLVRSDFAGAQTRAGRLKGEGHTLTYWQQNRDGRWEKKA